MQLRMLRGCLGLFLVVFGVSSLFPDMSGAADDDLLLKPDAISIGAFFQGAELTVAAVIPAKAEAVIEVRGPAREEHLVRKGRRWGMWMNVGDLTISNIPALYFYAATSPDLGAMPSASWGYAALVRQSHLSGALQPEGGDFFFKQFIALKESEGLFRSYSDGITTEPGPEGKKRITKVFGLPARMPPGVCRVLLHVVQEGGTILEKQRELQIAKVSLPSLVWTMAHSQPVLYGIAAVIIALIAGFLMGFFFKSKGAH